MSSLYSKSNTKSDYKMFVLLKHFRGYTTFFYHSVVVLCLQPPRFFWCLKFPMNMMHIPKMPCFIQNLRMVVLSTPPFASDWIWPYHCKGIKRRYYPFLSASRHSGVPWLTHRRARIASADAILCTIPAVRLTRIACFSLISQSILN